MMQPPYSSQFSEHYWSRSGGVEEKTHVFLEGNALPQRFAGAKAFTVAELGFGTGLNFALTAGLWAQTAGAEARLTYISYEQFPFAPADMQALQAQFPNFPQKQAFCEAYTPQPGWNGWKLGSLTLRLYAGEAETGLTTQPAPAEAWFLDGFSPAVNPSLWNEAVLAEVARLTVPNGTASTYSVARMVREGLQAYGFTVEKTPGHPPKRNMLKAVKMTT